jgi:hypothetical protein
MADTKAKPDRVAAAKEVLGKQKEERAKNEAPATRVMQSQPVPTQEENDLFMLGVGTHPLEDTWGDDGSGGGAQKTTKQMTSAPSARHGYETRGAGTGAHRAE